MSMFCINRSSFFIIIMNNISLFIKLQVIWLSAEDIVAVTLSYFAVLFSHVLGYVQWSHLHILVRSLPSYVVCIIFCPFIQRFCIRYGFWNCLDYCRYSIHTRLQNHIRSVCDNISKNETRNISKNQNFSWNYLVMTIK